MVMDEEYDLAVIGGRTIGAHLAKEFAEQEYDVLLVERGETVGEPFCCSGHYSEDLWEYVPKDEELIENRIRGARFHTAGRESRFYQEEPVSWVVDRKAMDQRMFQEAAEAGADTYTGTTLVGWDETDDGLELRLQAGEEELRPEVDMVAGCDGAYSTVRKQAGIDDPDMMVSGRLCIVEEGGGDDFVDVYVDDAELDLDGFFGWRIPREGTVEYGVGTRTPSEAADLLEDLVEQEAPRAPEDEYAAAIPMHPPDSVTGDRSFLVGDAAGQTKPFTGGGIVYGLRAGEKAAEAIDPADPATLEQYEDAWRDALMTDIRLGELLRRGYDAPSWLQYPLLRLFDGDVSDMHMDEPTSLFWRD